MYTFIDIMFIFKKSVCIAFLWYFLLTLTLELVQASSSSSSSSVTTNSPIFQVLGDESNVLSNRKMEKNIYALVDHLIRTGVYLSLSAVFAGLTIGIMCMDTLTIDIIANSGPEPDRTYASQILPLRRQGHQTLCTLVLSNMLMNVLVVQEVRRCIEIVHKLEYLGMLQDAVNENDALVGFIISTIIIIIFTEIIPMSICKSKYSLRIAAAGCVLVYIARILVYPVAAPLGNLLDCFVPHDAGQIYDRNELRKLMILHCEAHGERSGLVNSEVQLLIAAMDFQEKKVSDIMNPIENITTVKADEIITADVIERLWKCGRSRIPVETSPNNFSDILLVKDLLTVPINSSNAEPITIGDFVNSKSRVFATVHVNTALPTMLKFFQQGKTHMLLVFSENKDENFDETIKGNENEIRMYSFYRRRLTVEEGSKIVGVVTLEDVMEALIKEEIYDEYDWYENSNNEDTKDTNIPIPVMINGVPSPLPEPIQAPRANFYSYYVHSGINVSLTDAQVWAIAYYLTRTAEPFYLWNPGYVKMLLDECGDEQLIPPTTISTINENYLDSTTQHDTRTSLNSSLQLISPNVRSRSEALYTPTAFSTDETRTEYIPDLISKVANDNFILYRAGVQATTFTLVLSGSVEALINKSKLPFKRRSLQWLAAEALTSVYYAPDFEAVVLAPTRVYRISREMYEKYLLYNTMYTRACEGGSDIIMRVKGNGSGKKSADVGDVFEPQIGGNSFNNNNNNNTFNTGSMRRRSEDKEGLLGRGHRGKKMYGTFHNEED